MQDPIDDLDAATAAATAGIGARLASVRTARGVRVSALARQAGVSPSLISQIERGASKPSVGTLFALARVLGVPVDVFFSDAHATAALDPVAPGAQEPVLPVDPRPITDAALAGLPSLPRGRAREVVRRAERSSLEVRGGVRWERLTPTALDGVEFLELVYSPGAESDRHAYRHPGVEMVLVTQGTMTIFLGFERHDLQPGDSIAFPSTTPHRYVNLTDVETRAITVILRDDLSQMPIRESPEAEALDGEPV